MTQFEFKLPDIGEGMAAAEIGAWRVKVGDRVEEDQPLVDMMTDKASVELTSPVTGVVASLAAVAGETVAVGSVLVTLNMSAQLAAVTPTSMPVSPPATALLSEPQTPLPDEAAVRATVLEIPEPRLRAVAAPAVRRRATALQVELKHVAGTGPDGRITHADLDAYLALKPASTPAAMLHLVRHTDFDEVPVTGLRRQIAERMQLAKRQIPHFSYIEEADVTALEDLRASLNAAHAGKRPRLTLLPFLMRALVRALNDHPQINATYDDVAGTVRKYAAVHMGIATHTERGLMVIVVRDAQSRDVWNSAAEITRLSTKAKEGKATREELAGSTITITSLGALGGIATTPIINRPEVAIVGPNRIHERVVVRDGRPVVRKVMNVSSSFDHRIIDGSDAAQFIQRVCRLLEHPATLFMDEETTDAATMAGALATQG